MSLSIIIDSEMPKEILDFKISHYKEVFKKRWEEVFNANSFLDKSEQIIILKEDNKIAGACVLRKGVYSLKFKDFAILPENRGKGFAKFLMEKLEDLAIDHHNELLKTGQKPNDINLMYLRSIVYLNSNDSDRLKIPALEFAHFLKKFDFKPYFPNEQAYPYDNHELSKEEKVAIEIYRDIYPDFADRLKVFKKLIVDKGINLKDEIKQELLNLREKPDKWKIVMNGLDWKLGHYRKSGEVSYKFNICPICADMGVTNNNINKESSIPCPEKDCYIYLTCMEPFREIGFFKEDNEISNAYFKAMKDFMLLHSPLKDDLY